MGTIAEKLTYLNSTKQAIKQAIIDKGVPVEDTDTFRSYATKIADISSGGGEEPPQWSWPSGWPDILSIVENDTDDVYPYKCIFLLTNDCPEFDYTFGGNVEKVLTSDGTTYTDDFIHTWDPLQDVGEYRYVILYMSGNWTFQQDDRPISIAYNSAFMSGQTSAYSMFYECSSLHTIPLMDTSNITNFSQMFFRCYALKNIPPLNMSNATSTYKMFYEAYSIEAFPEVDLNNLISASYMFYACSAFRSFRGFNTDNVIHFSYMFKGCLPLEDVTSLNTSSGTNFSYMFDSCYALQEIPPLDTSNGTNFNSMFDNCGSLQEVPPLDTSNGTNFGYMFYRCFSLTSIPLIDTSKGTYFRSMFFGTNGMQSLPALDVSSGTDFGSMYSSCYALQHIDTSVPGSHIYNYSVSFQNSPYLSRASIINIFNNLPTKTGETITIDIVTDAKLSTADKEIATNKGWTVAVS